MAFYGKLSVFHSTILGKTTICYYCATKGVTNKDHFYPKSLKGKLQVRSCIECNHSKRNLTPRYWLIEINKKLDKCSTGIRCQDTDFIKSRCDGYTDDCNIRKKLLLIKASIERLLVKVEWSIPDEFIKPIKEVKKKQLNTVGTYKKK